MLWICGFLRRLQLGSSVRRTFKVFNIRHKSRNKIYFGNDRQNQIQDHNCFQPIKIVKSEVHYEQNQQLTFPKRQLQNQNISLNYQFLLYMLNCPQIYTIIMFVARYLRKIKPSLITLKQNFDLHEYQSKDLMRSYGILVQRGAIATTPEDAERVARQLNTKEELILKAQVHAGGRGKGTLSSGLKGGVQIVKTPKEIGELTKKMLGYNLVTHQTTKEGLRVDAVLVHEGVDIKRQIYLAFLLDRNTQGPILVASTKGGMDIEEIAKQDPHAIRVYPFTIKEGVTEKLLDQLEKDLDLKNVKGYRDQVKNLYKMFNETDATQIQINPWAVNPKNEIYCVDAKINVDDNAKFRQQKLVDLRKNSLTAEDVDPHQQKAIAAGLNYVALDGNIGCMVNGAGLAMATMDIIKLKGGDPANFLDVGGGANVEQVKTAFEILNSHPKVETILINIFGGIMKCDVIAQGIIQAAKLVDLKIPLVVRLTGTNAKQGNQLLANLQKTDNRLKVVVAYDLDDAAVKAVKTANQFAKTRK